MDRPRYDSAMFWLAFGTAAAVIGLALMTIGVTRVPTNGDLLRSGWFDGGLGLLVVGVLLLLWALWLFLTRRRAEAKAQATGGSPPRSESTEAEAVRAYYREREKLMDRAMNIWEERERKRRKS